MKVTPSTDRGRAAVTRILEAACALFADKGVRATTLDDVGAAAGVGRGQLYHYFDGKDDLVAEVVAAQVDALLGPLQPLLEAMCSAADLQEWCTQSVARYSDNIDSSPFRCPLGSLIVELDRGHDAARMALRTGFSRWESLLGGAVSRIAERGELTSGVDPVAVASALLAAYQGGVLLADVHRDVNHLARALSTVVTAFTSPMAA